MVKPLLSRRRVSEEAFWRNYFYRVGLIRQSTELSSLEKENPGVAEGSEDTPAAKEGEGNKGRSTSIGVQLEFLCERLCESSAWMDSSRDGCSCFLGCG